MIFRVSQMAIISVSALDSLRIVCGGEDGVSGVTWSVALCELLGHFKSQKPPHPLLKALRACRVTPSGRCKMSKQGDFPLASRPNL